MLLDQPQVRRWTKEEYYQAAELGWFEGQRVELIDGEVIEMAPQKDAHAFAVRLAAGAMQQLFGSAYTVLVQMPLNLGPRTEPEADVAVVKGSLREVREHPTSAELVIEISDTSLAYDRGRKVGLYALHAIPEYWIVNLMERRVEVYRQPTSAPPSAAYSAPEVFTPGSSLQPLALPDRAVAIDELLP